MQAVYLPLSENGETATGVLTAFAYEFSKRSVDEVASELRRA
jgi:hypothetical protein